MVVLIDLDNTLSDFDQGLIENWQEFSDLPIPDFKNRLNYEHETSCRNIVDEIIKQQGFFIGLKPYNNIHTALHTMLDIGLEVFIVTWPGTGHPLAWSEKHNWVKANLGVEFTSRLIICRDKWLVKGDLLIDDRPNLSRQHNATWQQVYFEQSYNSELRDGLRISDWTDWRKILI